MPVTCYVAVARGVLSLTLLWILRGAPLHAQVGVQVTPANGTDPVTRLANKTGYQVNFTVRNSGSVDTRYSGTCTRTGSVSSVTCTTIGLIAAGGQRTVTATFSTGSAGSGTVQLSVTSTQPTGASGVGRWNETVVSPPPVEVTPDGTIAPTRLANTAGHSESFTIKNNSAATTFTLSCGGSSNVTCTGVNPGTVTLASGAQTTATASYSVGGATGTGTLSLTATGSVGSDAGSYNIPVISYGVAVTPDGPPNGEAVARRANSSNFGETFTVKNTGTEADVFTFTCAGSANITCARDAFGNLQVNPSSLSLAGGAQGTVNMSYRTGASGTGQLYLGAQSDRSSNSGWYEIPVTSGKVGITPKNSWKDGAFSGVTYTQYFKITNTGTTYDTYTLTCSGSGVSCTGQSRPSVGPIVPGETHQEWVSYQVVAGSGNGYVQLIAEGPQALAIGQLNFTIWPYVAHAVSVTGGAGPQRGSFTNGHTATFQVQNVGANGGTYTFTCEASANVTCAGVSPSSKALVPFEKVFVTVTYNAGASGSANVGLRAANANANSLGQLSFTVVPSAGYAVAATPDAKAIGVLPSAPASYPFTIRNPGTLPNTYNFTASCTGGAIASGCTPSADSATIAAGGSRIITVSYTSGGAPSAGRILLTATQRNDAAVKDTAWVEVATGSAQAPLVAIQNVNPGTTVERDLCLTVALAGGAASECGDLRLAHALPVVQTMGRARGPTLVYSSANAHPYPLVAAEVTLPAGAANPDSVEVILRLNGVEKRRARWAGHDFSPGRANRVVIGYDASSDLTDAYSYTLEVANIYPGIRVPAPDASGQFVLVNRSQSAFGTGWWLAGIEHLRVDSMLWVGGDGSARVYRATGIADTWAAEAVDRPDTLKKVGSEYVRLLPAKREVWFDGLGRHVRTVSRLKHDTTFFYYAGVTTQLDSLKVPPANQGLKYAFNYNGSGVLTSVSAPGPTGTPHLTTLTLNGRQVTGITDPDTTTVSFGYDPGFANRIISRTDRENTPAKYFFDAASKVVRDSLDPSSSQEVIVRRLRALESLGFIGGPSVDTTVAYALIDGPRTDVGDSTQLWLDRFGAPRRIRNALGHETVMARENATYPALVTRMQGPNGRVTRATHDGRGRLRTSTDSGTIVNGQVAVTRYGWDDTWDAVTVVVPPEGDSTVIGIEPSTGRRLWQQDASGSGSRVDFTYHDDNGLLATIKEPGATRVTSLNYDARGNLRETISPIGFRDSVYRDNVGRDTLALTPIDSAQTMFQKKRTWYDLADQIKKTQTSGPAPNYTLTYVERDTTSVTADTVTVENTYDKEGRLKTVLSYASPTRVGDLLDTRTYDRAGRLLTQKFGSGPRTIVYDAAGNPISQTYAGAAAAVGTTYDALNRAIQRVVPRVAYGRTDCQGHAPGPIGGGGGICLMQFPFYPNLTGDSLEIPADTSVFAYDLAGNLVRADNRYAQVRRSYYANGRLETDTLRMRNYQDAAFGHVFVQRYRYDRNGRRTWMQVPLPALADSLTYAYSPANGALTEVRQSSGRWVGLRYTAVGRLDSLKVYPSVGGSAGILESRTYDEDGRLTRRERRTGVGGFLQLDVMSYDAQGRVREAVTHSAAQDHASKRTRTTYAGLGAVLASEVVELNTTNWEAEEFRTDALGNVWYDRWRSRDDHGKPPRRSTFNFRGLLTQRTRDVPPNCSGAPYTDSLYQTGDGGGNILRAGELYRPCEEGSSWTQGATNNYYTGDNKLAVSQRYDPGGRGTWEEYWTDALGRRVLIRARRETGLCGVVGECASFVQRTVWDGDQILVEQRTNSLDALGGGPPHYGTVGYVHALGIDQPVMLLDGRVLHYNWRRLAEASSWSDGTPADCQVGSGNCTKIAWPAGQGVYFRRGVPEPSTPVPTWIGSLPSNGASTTGQLYRRNRYYDPASGRFTQEDPIGLAGGLNLYGFANGDPVNFHDPFGLDAIYIHYDGYPINTGFGFSLPLGHAAVIAVDKNGYTRYYEYGRYDKEGFGVVRRRSVPNLVMGKDGKPTAASLKRLYDFVSRNYGKGKPVSAEYDAEADYQKVVDFAEQRMNDPNRDPYNLLTNNCKTFARDACEAGKKKEEKPEQKQEKQQD